MATIQEQEGRRMRGQAIADHDGQIKRIDENEYQVKSQSGNGLYQVLSTEFGWACSCPDNQYRGLDCKHILGTQISLALRKIVEAAIVIQPVSVKDCPKCDSESVKRAGIRHNVSGNIQKLRCKACGYWFTVNLGFERMHATPQMITGAMQLYFTGESFRNVQKFLKLQGVKVSHQTIWNWVQKYVKLMEDYLSQITPKVGETWRTDELYLKVKGDRKYLFAMLDDQTRFWIAQQIADNKGTSDVRPMFREARQIAGKKPKTLISDGAYNFKIANRKEYCTQIKANTTEHIRHIRIQGDHNNNKMESFNGELRDREKTTRNLKTVETPILKGMQLYHNYFRPHMGLDGDTPAERAGITIEGENPWITVIQNAQMTRLDSLKKAREMTVA
jgi:putative transposase